MSEAAHGSSDGKIALSVVTPEGAAFEGRADHVVVPGHDGEVAFYPSHAPYVGLLGAGELRLFAPGGSVHRFFVAGGVVQTVDDTVTVLAESVVPAGQLDEAAARADLEKAAKMPSSPADAAAARDKAIAAARAKLRVATAGRVSAH